MLLKTAIQKLHDSNRISAVQYRRPLPVTKILLLGNGDSFPICPRCGSTFDREYVRFCDRCGQYLTWERFQRAKVVSAPRKCGCWGSVKKEFNSEL